ncbi:MAG: prolyl oligopeptidase family serine peptidase [Ginsengibacter sp.]
MKKLLLSFIVPCFLFVTGYAQDNLTYQLPPKSITDLLDAPNTPSVRFNRDGSKMLLLQSSGNPSIEEVAQPVIGVATLRLNPLNNSSVGSGSSINDITVKDVKSGQENKLSGLPVPLRMEGVSWSPDGNYIAFTNNVLSGIELWVADIKTLKARKLSDQFLNDAFGSAFQWHPNSTHLLARFIVANRKKPVENLVPTGPVVQENLGEKTPSRTYQYLLQNPYDEELMEYYLTAQLQLVGLDGQMTKVSSPAIFRGFSYSPDGNYLMVQTIEKPYSYLVPISSFPYQTSILSPEGKLVKQLYLAPLADKTPISFDAVAPGPRSYQWRNDVPATIVWAEAQDGGNSNLDVPFHDALFSLKAPFTDQPQKLFSMQFRYGGVDWGNKDYAIVSERWRRTRASKMTLINPETGVVIKEISNRSSEDTYTDPGNFVMEEGLVSRNVLLFDKSKNPVVFTRGTGASPQGDRPFLMRWDLLSGKQDTLFKSKAPYYESVVFFNNKGTVYISRESTEDVPNFYMLNLKNKKETALTKFEHPYPGMDGVQKTLISYPRKDGVMLSAQMYLPKDFKKGDTPLPVLVWAYPREFKTLEAAGQVKGSPHRFTRLSFISPVLWVTRGYAVLDQADMPIVGEGKTEHNDSFVEQVIDNANALINYVVDIGVADRNRIGVGGHSYGAFMTANLLAHTDLFAAGIARSGAYNRTLTPFGFQAESRTFWEAPDVYGNMSPFYFANKIKTPILLTHGMDDDNSGTFPIQSERLYSAIKGHGGTVRLVMLPKEFHGYRSRESLLHTFWEQDQWLEKYVKNRKVDAKKKGE